MPAIWNLLQRALASVADTALILVLITGLLVLAGRPRSLARSRALIGLVLMLCASFVQMLLSWPAGMLLSVTDSMELWITLMQWGDVLFTVINVVGVCLLVSALARALPRHAAG